MAVCPRRLPSPFYMKLGQLRVSAMRHVNASLWLVCAGRLMRRMSLTRTHHATVVGPIRFSNRSNNCRVCKINGRRSSLVRTHHATIVFSSSLRPTEDENRMVCAGLKSRPVTNHSIMNFRDISVTMTFLQSYIQELGQGIYVKIISHKLR